MAPPREQMLAVKIQAATEMRKTLPPSAFARVTVWSHGRASADTCRSSEWENAKPLLLPIASTDGLDRAVELEVSLWDRSGDVAIMFDAVAEVSIPAPRDLGTSEVEETDRIFPLEEEDTEVGLLTLRAWMVNHGTESARHEDAAGNLSTETSPDSALDLDVISSGSASTTGIVGGKNDDDGFFDLSASSSSSSKSNPIPAHSSDENTVGGSNSGLSSVETNGNGGGPTKGQHACHALTTSRKNVHEPNGDDLPEACDRGVDADAPEHLKHYREETTPCSRHSSRWRNSAQRATSWTDLSDEDLPQRVASSTSGARAPLSTKPRRGTTVLKDSQPKSKRRHTTASDLSFRAALPDKITEPALDLAAAALPLIPSYAPGSAKVDVWVHSIILPASTVLKTLPYVRVGVHPGASGMARTGLSRGPTPMVAPPKACSSTSVCCATSTPSILQSTALEYRFRDVGDATPPISVPLVPDLVSMLAEGYTSPTLRLEMVSGRSIGRCDVSLPEVLRRPGNVCRQLQLPLWEKEHCDLCDGERHSKSASAIVGLAAGQERSTREGKEGRAIVGHIIFDVGVMLADGDKSTDADMDRFGAGCAKVEISGVRGQVTSGPGLNLTDAQRAGLLGVSTELSLGGATKFTTFDTMRIAATRGPRTSGREPPPCDVILSSPCIELDAVVLRLVWRSGQSAVGNLTSNRFGEGCGSKRGQEYALVIPTSDINDIFEGHAHWLAINCVGLNDRKRGIGRQIEAAEGGAVGTHRWEVRLRMVVTKLNLATVNDREIAPAEGRSEETVKFQRTLLRGASDSCDYINAHGASPLGGASCHAFDSWVSSVKSGCTQARAFVSTLPSRWARRDDDVVKRTEKTNITNDGPGFLNLEVIAIHGHQGCGITPESSARESALRQPAPWRVRVGISGGSEGNVTVDSSKRFPEETPGNEHPAEWDATKGDGMVLWPRGKGARVRYALHWTPRQSVLPMVTFEIFRGQNSAAQSVLDVAPMVMLPGRVVSFLHPCVGTDGRNGAASNHNAVHLEIRCVFEGASCGGGGQHGYGSVPQTAPGPAPRISTQRGGILCVQVMDIRHLHLAARSGLRLPFLVVFSLPFDGRPHENSACFHRPGREREGGSFTGARTGQCKDGQTQENSRHASLREEDGSAFLRVEPGRRGSTMVSAALFDNNIDRMESKPSSRLSHGSPCKEQAILGATWFPVSEDVMKGGHLSDGWYPLRTGGSRRGARACEMRLRLHFVPDLQQTAARTSKRLSSQQDAEEQYLTVVLEQGRDLSHPLFPGGPRELFAEVFVDDSRERPRDGVSPLYTYRYDGLRAEVVVGSLPLGDEDFRHPLASGNGASPCWNHILRVPLSPMGGCRGVSAGVCGDQPGAPGAESRGSELLKPLLTVVIKSAARRVVYQHQMSNSRSLTQVSPFTTLAHRERQMERCLVIGAARIRLPSCMLRQKNGDGCFPLRGWYTVKDEDGGAHRGEVKLSVYPSNGSKHVSSTIVQQRLRGRRKGYSDNAGCPADWGDDDPSSDSSECMEAEEEAASVLARTTGSTFEKCKGIGLLLISVRNIAIRARKTETAVPLSDQVKACAAIRHPNDCYQEVSQEASAPAGFTPLREYRVLPPTSSKSPANRCAHIGGHVGDRGVATSKSASSIGPRKGHSAFYGNVASSTMPSSEGPRSDAQMRGENGASPEAALEASLRVGRYHVGEAPALHLRVSVKPPCRPLAVFHGAVNLSPCLSSVGLGIQEQKGLMQTTLTAVEDDDNVTGGSSSSGATASEQAKRGEGRGAKAEKSFCTIHVTTTFVPHTSGVLAIAPSELHLVPPSHKDMDRLRALAVLRDSTDQPVGVGQGDNHRACGSIVSAFLRVRVLPSGPWAFSSVFDVKWPRPVDWGRLSSEAGEGAAKSFSQTQAPGCLPSDSESVCDSCLRMYYGGHQSPSSFSPSRYLLSSNHERGRQQL